MKKKKKTSIIEVEKQFQEERAGRCKKQISDKKTLVKYIMKTSFNGLLC